MSALSLARSSVVGDSSYSASAAAPALLAVDPVAAAAAAGKLSTPTNSLQCPRATKRPVRQNSISVRDLFPAAYARSSAGRAEPGAGTDSSAANHVPAGAGLAGAPPPQIVCNSPSHYSPVTSSDKSTPASPDR